MQSNSLKPVHSRIKSPRVGRGGKRGKTSGRGMKGQKARSGRKMRPEMRDLIKKLPKLRGEGKNRARTVRAKRVVYVPVNLETLEAVFAAGDTITPAVLVEKGIISMRGGRLPKVKILGTGVLSKNFSITGCAASASAKEAVGKAGGSIL